MLYDIKPEISFRELVKRKGALKALFTYNDERDMWCAINDNYNLFMRNLGILNEKSWVKYIKTDTKYVFCDKTHTQKGVYVLHRLRLSDDICAEDLQRKIKHLAEKMVLSVDYKIKENQEEIMAMGVKRYTAARKRNPDYMQSTKYIKSKKHPLERLTIGYENGEVLIKIFYEELPIRHFKPIKPKEGKVLVGMDTNYNPVWWDWSKDINMLIAGETGSGKTTIVHALLINCLCYSVADFYLIDRKDSDFRVYQNKKGVIAFGVNQEEGTAVIEQFFEEFQRRRLILHENNENYLNIAEYNRKNPTKVLKPYVLCIDEFADIAYECMKGDNIDMSSPLGKILIAAAQIRNTGGHIILATQRPSADIIKGILRAQFSAQFGLKVINQINSNIVIGEPGLENLSRFCFKVRLEGELVDGIGYYLDTDMIKKYMAELPDRNKRDKFFDANEQGRLLLLEKIEKKKEEIEKAEIYIAAAQEGIDKGHSSAIKKMATAQKKYEQFVSEIKALEAEYAKAGY